MAGALNMLVILPIIMTACGIFSIASSVIIIFILAICNSAIQGNERNLAAEEKAHASIIKLEIQYSKVPIIDRNTNIVNVDDTETETSKLKS